MGANLVRFPPRTELRFCPRGIGIRDLRMWFPLNSVGALMGNATEAAKARSIRKRGIDPTKIPRIAALHRSWVGCCRYGDRSPTCSVPPDCRIGDLNEVGHLVFFFQTQAGADILGIS
jgi:hypothetical protein